MTNVFSFQGGSKSHAYVWEHIHGHLLGGVHFPCNRTITKTVYKFQSQENLYNPVTIRDVFRVPLEFAFIHYVIVGSLAIRYEHLITRDSLFQNLNRNSINTSINILVLENNYLLNVCQTVSTENDTNRGRGSR